MDWNLQKLFADDEAWEKDFQKSKAVLDEIDAYEGNLSSFEVFREYFERQREVTVVLERLYQYAQLKSDLDKKNVANAARLQRIGYLLNEFRKKTAFEAPEILALGREKVFSFLEKDEGLQDFRFPLEKLFHTHKHVLDKKSENLLAHYGLLAQEGGELHSSLSIADNEACEVTLEDGRTITVTSGNYQTHLAELKDPADREKVFYAIFSHFDEHKHTFAQIYDTVLQADVARMRARGYANTRESYLFANKIDASVYENLVAAAKETSGLVRRYYALRKKALDLEEHRTFDRFLPLAESKSKFDYTEAKELFLEAVAPYGETMLEKAKDALEDGYVDVWEKDGKATGAYSSSVSDTHPFILLNFDKTLSDVFTLAHEAGHSMHSLFATETQPIPTQSYSIFVAEIASTFNEHVLLDHFLKTGKGTKADRIRLIQQALDDMVGTFYRQTLFAAYELEAHRLAEQGEPVTHESLSAIMVSLYKEFYDIDIEKEPAKRYVWAYIPHFFQARYYVYQYATSFAASLKLYTLVEKDKKDIEKHIGLLRAGGNDFPMEQVKRAGIDLTKKEAFLGVAERFETLLEELTLALED